MADKTLTAILISNCADDYSNSFGKIRGQLVNSEGIRVADFVRTLKPNYGRVYLDIVIGYAALLAAISLICFGQAAGVWSPLLVGLGAILIGSCYLHLLSFFHEGVHFNLAPTRAVNDVVTNVLLSWLVGVGIDRHRKRHFEHHRALGTIDDRETSYFLPLNLTVILHSVLGIRAVQALVAYGEPTMASTAPMGSAKLQSLIRIPLIWALTVHGLIVAALWIYGWTDAALAWVLGAAAVMPLLNTVRQILEHRTLDATPGVDYSTTNQGACARMFGGSLIDRAFGSAGAGLHLLHHWEPNVPYARLPELERFLADTPARILIDRRRTTYFKMLRRMLARSRV